MSIHAPLCTWPKLRAWRQERTLACATSQQESSESKVFRRREKQLQHGAHILGRVAKHVRFSKRLPEQIRKSVQSTRGTGASDRRLYSEIAYTAVRYWPLVEKVWTYLSRRRAVECAVFLCMHTKDTMPLKEHLVHALGYANMHPDSMPRELLDALSTYFSSLSVEHVKPHRQHGGDAILPLEQNFPSWFVRGALNHCKSRDVKLETLEWLQIPARLWIRVRSYDDVPTVEQALQDVGYSYERSAHASTALKVERSANISDKDIALQGLFEVQDVSSQMVLENERVDGQLWLDACSGAGGKTLQLASKGADVVAEDVRHHVLDELKQRARRSGHIDHVRSTRLTNTEAPTSTLDKGYDGVLADCPCDGSGTWRRQVHLKWATTEGLLRAKFEQQLRILSRNARRVKPGGRLIYSTCSLTEQANGEVVEQFLADFTDFKLERLEYILPQHFDGDGFGVARLVRLKDALYNTKKKPVR